jgi:hypothetical protein
MSLTYIQVFFFGLGILIQAISLAGFENVLVKKRNETLIAVIAAVISFIVSYLKEPEDVEMKIVSSLLFLCIIFAILFQKELIKPLHERTVLIFTLLFWYLWVTQVGAENIMHWPLFQIALLPTLAAMFLVIIRKKLSFPWKLFMYTWYLVILASYALVLIWEYNEILWCRGVCEQFNLFHLFLLGGVTFFAIVNFFYLFILIPLPGKNQTFKERIEDWKEFTQLMTSKYQNKQLSGLESLFLFIGMGILLAVNYRYQFFDHLTLINTVIIILSFINLLTGAEKE